MSRRPSMAAAIRAKCCDCMNWFADGRQDCEVTTCSLYHWQRYRRLEPDTDGWMSRLESLRRRYARAGAVQDAGSEIREGDDAR